MNAAGSIAPPLPEMLGDLHAVDDETITRLRSRLVAAAVDEGLLDVAYRTLDTPLGSLLLATTATGLVRVAYAGQDHAAVLSDLAAEVSPRVLWAPGRLDDVARELEEYFEGRRDAFDLALDLRLAHGFRRDVVSQLQRIRYGATRTYGEVAAATGRPKATRAVGTACRLNPLPIVVPCHRVVRADGSPGEYAGGVAAKRQLLALEARAA
jgi:methylated-DNA-[protein]-cysteine S-methyltransferase